MIVILSFFGSFFFDRIEKVGKNDFNKLFWEVVMSREKGVVLEEILNQFKAYLLERENSPATIQKYLTDIRTFFFVLQWISRIK